MNGQITIKLEDFKLLEEMREAQKALKSGYTRKAITHAERLESLVDSKLAGYRKVMAQMATMNLETSHVVKPGETLSAIAARYGVRLDVLMGLNPDIEDPDLILVGQVIQLKARGFYDR